MESVHTKTGSDVPRMSSTYTCQSRLNLAPDITRCLADCAKLFSRIQRHLYAAYCRGEDIQKCKTSYIKDYGITARQFNAIRISLEGIIKSSLVLLDDRIQTNKRSIKKYTVRVKTTQKRILKLKKQEQDTHELRKRLHIQKRALLRREHKLAKQIADSR